MENLIDQITTAVAGVLAILVSAFMVWLTSWLRARFKIQTDMDYSEALNKAIDNAAGGVINTMGNDAVTKVVQPNSPAVKEAVAYVEKLNPDAVAHFNIKPAALAEKVVNSVGKQTAPALKG